MQINNEAPLVTERNIFIQAPPESVWKVHTENFDAQDAGKVMGCLASGFEAKSRTLVEVVE